MSALYRNRHKKNYKAVKQDDLSRRILAACLSASFASQPLTALAGSITASNGTKYVDKNGVFNIYAQQYNGKNNAINQFQKFQLDAGKTANLYFHTEKDSREAQNLLNFVDTRIDINGTLNAIRNKQIGGNLFFLSPEGMVVGKGGVINTGSLYVMAPSLTQDFTDKDQRSYAILKGNFDTGIYGDTELENIKNGTANIRINASGTISVLGKINATNEVKLYAGKVAVGKDLTGDTSDGTAAGGIEKGAAITTGVTDFSQLVNLNDQQQKDMGLTTKLIAAQDGSGDVVLSARSDAANSLDQTFNDLVNTTGLLGSTDINVPKTITASVENYGTVKAAGDATLTAKATNGYFKEGEEPYSSKASSYAQTVAKVDVQGNVTAQGAVEMKASADNTYVDSGNSITDKLGDTISYVVPVSANVMLLENEASVTVGKDATVTGDTVKAEAEANLDGTAGTVAAGKKYLKKIPSEIPATGVSYAQVDNKATVQIDGKVKATGNDTTDSDGNKQEALQVKANATSSVTNSANAVVSAGLLGAGSSSIVAAVAVTNSDNNAQIKVNGTAEADKGSVKMDADATQSLNTAAAAQAPDTAVGTAAVDVIVHDGDASIDVQGTVKADQDVTLTATNHTEENTHSANNNLGQGKFKAQLMKGVMKAADVQGIVGKVKENPLVKGALSKASKNTGKAASSGSGSSKSLTDTLGNTLSAGAAITVAQETTTAQVNFGKASVTEAGNGSLKVSASNTVYDTLLTANGVTSTFKNKDSDSDTVTIAVGTVFGGMNNSAKVTVEDGTKTQKAQLKAGRDLSLTTSSRMDYNRVTEIKKGLDDSIQAVKSAAEDMKNWEEMATLPELKKIYEELVTLEGKLEGLSITFYKNYLKHAPDGTNLTAEGTLNEVTNLAATGWDLYNQFLELQDAALTLYSDIQAQDPLRRVKEQVREKVTNLLTSPIDVVSASMEYLSPNNYANISAAASAKGGADTAVATAASVTVSDFNFDSQVKVGRNAQLTAGDTLNLQADEAIKDVTMTGKSKLWLNNAATGKADGVGLGGSLDYQDFDNNTLVQVDKGASLTAGDMALASSSDVFHTGVMLSAGKADGSAISGMMALTNSDSSNQVLVDKDALLKAAKDEAKSHKGGIAITGYNNTNVNNAILSLSAGSGAAAAGMAAAVNNIDVTNRAAVENLTTSDDDDDKGQIEAAALQVNAETTGLMNAVSVAGGVTSSGTEPEKGKTEKGGMSTVGNLFGKVTNPVGTVTDAVGTVSNKVKDAITWVNTGGKSQGGTQTPVPTKSDTAPSFSLAGAGSLSLNLVDDTTQAVVDGATVKLNNDGTMSVGTRDTAYVGAYSGGAAISLRKGKGSKDNTSVAFSGAVGMNSIDNTIEAAVRRSTLTGVKSLDIEALSGGTSVAAGTALALTKSGQAGNNFAGGASASVNLIDKDVKALAENNTVTGKSATEKANVDVTAYESDLQITGGVNADVAIGGGNAAGGSLTVANINNNLEAGIHGGTYANIGDTQVQGLLATKQISAAISAGVAVGGNGTDNAFTGAMLYNGLHNTVSADISDGASITADSIAVKAHDTTSGSDEAKGYEDQLGTYRVKESLLQDAGVDTDGSSYYKTSDSSNGLDTAGEKVDFDGNKGSLSVGAAFVVAGSKDNAAGAAVNVANLDNTFTAKIDDAALTADAIAAQAEADSLAVNVTAGVAAGSKDYGGMGSVTWQDQDNRVQSRVTDSTLTTDDLKVHASSNAQAVNVAGSVAYGKTAGIGAALAYNGLDNHIGAYLAGGSVTAKTPSTGVSVDVEGKNTGKIYGLGAAVAASQKAAVNGTVVVNHGGSDTEAAVGEVRSDDGTSTTKATAVADAKAVTVKAESDDVRVAAAGNVSASGKAAVGGAVAYNDVGGASTSTAKASQKTRAALNQTTLTHVTGGTTAVQAVDGSTLTTAAVGVGGAGKVAIQGAAATALVNKAVTAEVQDSTVDQDADKGASVTVKADSRSTINSLAVVGAGSGDFAGGAGVSVNRINQDTNASLSGSTVKDKHTTVQADGDSTITSVGIGAAVAGKAALAGNIAVNQIGSSVKAAVTGSTLTSSGNIGVLASGKETLTNFAGTVSGTAGNAGLGMGVSYNAITGNTESTVTDSTLEARGSETETVGNGQKGVAVTAAGQHTLNSVALTAGLAGSDNVAVGAAGTVTVNNIGGTTRAAVTGTDINAGLHSSTVGDVAVKAQDVTTSESHVGSLSVGIGADGGAGVSAASDTLLLSRKTAAELSGTDAAKKTVNGRNVAVTADQQSTVVTNADGVAGAGGVYGAGAVAATAAATKLDGSVSATMKNITSTNKGLEISAKHDHKTTLVSASAAVSAAMVSGAVGAGVGVVNDDFTTAAELTGSTVAAKKDSSRSGSGSVNVAADSSTGVTTVVAGVAGSVGAAASTISVNNMNSQTSAVVDASTVAADQDFTVDAHNQVTTKFNAATLGAGGAAIATGVGVNTIGTSTLAKVNKSTITAQKAAITSREDLDVDQNLVGATVGGLGINANVMVTSIGTKLADTYGSSANKGASFDAAAALEKANTALDSQKTATTDETTASGKVVKDTLHNTDTGVESNDASGVTASSGKSDAKGTQVAVAGSAITTGDTLSLKADRQTDAAVTAAAASVGSVDLSATVAVLDAKKDAGVTISGSTLTAGKDLSVLAKQGGTTGIMAYQGNISALAGISAAYAQSSSSGSTAISLDQSTLQTTKGSTGNITVQAEDKGATSSKVVGVTTGAFGGGALITKADNKSGTSVSLKDSTLSGQNDVAVTSRRANTVTAGTTGGAVGAATLQGVVAGASDAGSSTVVLTGKNALSARTLELTAQGQPRVSADAKALGVSLVGGGASVATAEAGGTVALTAAEGSSFTADSVALTASSGQQSEETKDSSGNTTTTVYDNAKAEAVGNATAIGASVGVNKASAKQATTVKVDLGKGTYKTAALTVTGSNTAALDAAAKGVTIGGYFASGTNETNLDGQLTTNVTAAGADASSSLGDVTVRSSGYGNLKGSADGSGGGYINVSPVAARANTSLTTDTRTSVSGGWKASSLTASATNSDNLDVTADSLTAAVLNGSGTEVKTTVSHKAQTDVTGSVTTSGKQAYTAANEVSHTVDLKGNGYGGATVNANAMTSNLSYAARVNLDKATLATTGEGGSLTAAAGTGGTMTYLNQLKSAGVIPVTVAKSTDTVTYDNSVSATDSTLTTGKADQDITLAANDDTTASFKTVADTQGGAVGAASASMTNTLSRSNKIALSGGKLESTNDVNLYAGADQDGINSSLDYSAISDAYNRTALPIATAPSLANTMTQANQVAIDGTVESVRHTNLKAGKGLTTVAESAQEYNVYTGDKGNGSVTSTALGTHTASETTDNKVSVGSNGSVTAGIHTDLDVTIGGKSKPTGTGEDTKLDVSGITVTVNKGSDWFSPASVDKSSVLLENSLKKRYDELSDKAAEYSTSSNEYKTLKAEMDSLRTMMAENGFIKGDSVLDSVGVGAVVLPDIVVSGGNINVDADSVSGSGSLTAKGAEAVNITNNSDLYLKTGDIIIKDKGGEIRYNDGQVSQASDLGAGFTGKVASSSAAGTEPKITLSSTGTSTNGVTTPDIGIFGTIQNANGDVVVKNANGNIFVDSNANVSARNITMSADKGSVTQISDGWLLVGSDPITRYQINDSIAKKIQKFYSQYVYLSENGRAETEEDYKNALLQGNYSYKKDGKTYTVHGGSYEEYLKIISQPGVTNGSFTPPDLGFGFTTSELDAILAAFNNKDSSAGIHAGQNVYLSGKNVIIDGLVQSGYDTYKTTLSQADASKVWIKDLVWNFHKVALTDDQVLGNSSYLINNGGSYYNQERGVWEYAVKTYYNPYTKHLLTEAIAPAGGKIYINGAVASTSGTGRLLAMDGTPDVSIDTSAVSRDLTVNAIRNQDIDGLISIKDTNNQKQTEYRNSGGKTTVTVTDGDGRVTTSTVDSAVYTPEAQTLKWTGGTTGGKTVKVHEYDKNFVLWGLIKYKNTGEFLSSIANDVGNIQTPSQYQIAGDQTLDSGMVITKGGQKNAYEVTTKQYADDNDASYSDVTVKTEYKGFWGKVFGYGKARYRWTETVGNSTSSTYSIQADKPIDVGFLTQGKDTISITGARNVDLAGSITSAGTGGTVTLTSRAGGITAMDGASVNTDSLTAQARGNISLAHSAVGTGAAISLSSDGGSVTLKSDKGDLTVDKAVAGSGSLYLQADGNLKGSSTLKGNRIDLISRKGAIDAAVATADTPVDSDPLSASLNAQAAGNITLTNAGSGSNMRLGHIISSNGDVTLTTDGSFEDVTGEGTLSSGRDKLSLWKEMGLVADESADSHTKAAEAAKKERLDGLDVQGAKLAAAGSGHTLDGYKAEAAKYASYAASDTSLQAAKATYEKAVKANAGDDAALEAAYKTYDAARKAYFDGKGYTTEEQDFILAYADVNDSKAYGWSQNDLLYAIQSSVLNASPKDEVVTVDTPNIKGKNITLNAGKNIGVDGTAKEIAYTDLNKLENLQTLSQAKAGDLTWNDTSLTVRQQQPITLQLNGGKVTLNANTSKTAGAGSIYLAGVKDTALDITGKINTSADVKLMSDKGVKMEEGGITARNLTITGGTGDIGSSAHNLLTNLSGSLDARTRGNLYLHQTGLDNSAAQVLTLQSVAGGKINLSADAGMKMTTENGKTSGTINGDEVNLVSSDGSLGLADDGLRVKNTGVLSADAQKGNIYLSGKDAGTLTLANVNGKDEFVLQSEGTVKAGREAADGVTAVDSQIKAAKKVTLDAAGSIDLKNGSLTTDTLALKAGGHISQTAAHAITAPTVSLDAASGIDLKSGADLDTDKVFNDFQTVTVKNGSDTTDVTIGSGGSKDLKVSFDAAGKAKNVTVRNYKNGAVNDLTVNGPVTAVEGISLVNDEGNLKTTGTLTVGSGRLHEYAAGALENEDGLTGEDIILKSTRGMVNKSLIATNKVELTAANDILNQGIVQAGTSVGMKSDTGSITNKGDVEARGGDVTLDAKTDLHNQGAVMASQDVKLTSGGSMANDQAVTAGRNLTMDAGTTLTNSGALTASTGSADLQSGGAMSNGGAVTAGTTVTMTSTGSSITNNGAVEAKNGDVTLDAKTDLHNADTVKATQDVSLTSGGSMANDKAVTAGRNLTMDAGTTLDNGGDLTATDGSIGLTAETGIRQQGNATAGRQVALTTTHGPIQVTGAVSGKTGASARVLESGSITIGGSLTATESGDAVAETKAGDVTIDGRVEAKTGDATVKTGSGNVLVKGKVDAGSDATIQSDNGSVTIENGSLTGGQEVKASATNGNVSIGGSVIGGTTVTAQATEGNVTIDGSIESRGGDTQLRASDSQHRDDKGNISVLGTLTSSGAALASTDHGSITIGSEDRKGTVKAGTRVALTTVQGPITVHGTAEGKQGALAQVTDTGSIAIDGDLLASSSGDAVAETNSGDVHINGRVEAANGNATVRTGSGDVDIDGSLKASGNGTAQSDNGKVQVKGAMEAGNDLVARSGSGDVAVAGQMTAGHDLTAQSDNGSVTVDGQLQAGNDLIARGTNGSVTVKGQLQAGNDLTAETTGTGDVLVDGSLTAGRDLHTSTQQGSLELGGNVQVGRDLQASTQQGDVDFKGTAQAGHDLTATTQTGSIAFQGDVKTGSDLTASTRTGDIAFQGNVESGKDLTATTRTGGIAFQGNVESAEDLTATTSQGDITFNGKVEAGRNLEAWTQQEGTITLRQDVTGGADLQFATNNGSIRFEGNDPQQVEDIHVTSQDGDVSLTITGRGNMEDSHRQANGDRAVVEAGSGNITLEHTGVGDVDLYSLLAGKKAGVEVDDGSLYLDTINGDLIAVYVKNPQKTTAIEHMEAGSRLSLSGATINVAEITQRPGADGTLTLNVDGAGQAAPVESLTIGDIKAADGVRVPHLWVRNGALKTSQGTLQLDKLFVLDKATFSNGTMITDVFGTTPRTDESVHSVYWINTKLARPQENLNQWLADAGRGGRWMYLLFDRQGHTQFSNGNLVDLDPHNYVYNQRYSETNWTRTQEDRDFSNFWTPYFHPELTYSNRYDLVDGSRAVLQPAKADITVEEV
ncbi:MAG: leukotoxin LktA family filamentous adhesin [Acidaminococcus sp.]|uniref:leukotoxin LktA family filamentous adhesin n=1 Tax=Acidaminococcus sp. TaxID=1872103 RepID=UPI003F163394